MTLWQFLRIVINSLRLLYHDCFNQKSIVGVMCGTSESRSQKAMLVVWKLHRAVRSPSHKEQWYVCTLFDSTRWMQPSSCPSPGIWHVNKEVSKWFQSPASSHPKVCELPTWGSTRHGTDRPFLLCLVWILRLSELNQLGIILYY